MMILHGIHFLERWITGVSLCFYPKWKQRSSCLWSISFGYYLATLFLSCKVWQLQRWENDYKTVSVVLSKNLLDWKPAKGQIKPKADWHAVDSPKKWKNEFVLFTVKSKQTKFLSSFFGRIYSTPICFRFYLTFS